MTRESLGYKGYGAQIKIHENYIFMDFLNSEGVIPVCFLKLR